MNLLQRTKKFDAKNPNLTSHISKAIRQLEFCKDEIESILGHENTNFGANFDNFLESGSTRALGFVRGIERLIEPYTHDWVTIPQEADRQLYNLHLDLYDLYVELYLANSLSLSQSSLSMQGLVPSYICRAEI